MTFSTHKDRRHVGHAWWPETLYDHHGDDTFSLEVSREWNLLATFHLCALELFRVNITRKNARCNCNTFNVLSKFHSSLIKCLTIWNANYINRLGYENSCSGWYIWPYGRLPFILFALMDHHVKSYGSVKRFILVGIKDFASLIDILKKMCIVLN